MPDELITTTLDNYFDNFQVYEQRKTFFEEATA